MRVIEFDYPVKQVTCKTVGERKLSLYIFEPEHSNASAKNRTVILFFNGGSFKKGPLSPAQFQNQARYLASQGVVSVCVDYRNGHDEGFTPIQAISDAKTAVGWVRSNATKLGIDPNRVVMCGASAGGYTAVSSIMFDEFNDDNSTNYIPNALIVFAAGMDGVDIMDRLFPHLAERATDMSPVHHIKKCLPLTLWMCGTSDELYEQNLIFVEQMNKAGNNITFLTYEGMGHGFFNYGWHDNNPYNDTTLKIQQFLASL
ncbi:alpha/beta hydrolase [Paenibacillus sp. 453mf]|uniref:alpha/beta hydrolase n=1 Tax=Paenibacillus sp. 453mf TaxID=1761874 RepID=UPI0008F30DC9|nr:alpha/beta hydrolase [Paenibacillus sp. 453mf]SFS53126.1 Acetyl esterase/lipase [Paenibacillus sp. 453mf]